MDEDESKIQHPSVPPGYISCNQLRERWLQKQQEKKLKEEMQQEKKKLEEEMKREQQKKKKLEEQMKQTQQKKRIEQEIIQARGNAIPKQLRNGKFEKQSGVIEEEEESAQGKEIQKNGERKNTKKKKKKNWSKKKQSLVGVEKDNPRTENSCNIHELDGKMEQPNESLGVKIISKVESKLGNEGNVSVVDGLPRNGGRKDSTVNFGGRFRRNGNDQAADRNFQEYRVKAKDYRMEIPLGELGDKKGNGMKWSKRRNGGNRLKENIAEIDGLKGNELEIKSEKLPDDEVLGVGSKLVGINGNGPQGIGERDQREDSNDKSQDDDSVFQKIRAGGNGEAENESMRFHNRRSNTGVKLGEHSVFSDVSTGNERARVEMNVGYNRRHVNYGRSDGWKPRQRNSQMVWVKNDDNLAVNNAPEVGSTGISPDEQ